MKGRKPKPTEEHKANGTYQPVRHAGRLEAPPLSAIPPAPADFDKDHAAKWNSVCGLLLAAEILAEQDTDAIRTYVESNLTATRTYRQMLKEGFTMSTKHGDRLNPLWRVYQDARKLEKQMYDQFGFTPRARMGMKVDKKETKPEDPAALFN